MKNISSVTARPRVFLGDTIFRYAQSGEERQKAASWRKRARRRLFNLPLSFATGTSLVACLFILVRCTYIPVNWMHCYLLPCFQN